MVDLLSRLQGVARDAATDGRRVARRIRSAQQPQCSPRDGRWLLKCHAGCEWQDILDALGLEAQASFDEEFGGGGRSTSPNNRATAQPNGTIGKSSTTRTTSSATVGTGLTLDQYGAAKNIPAEFLKAIRLTEISYDRKAALRIPYFGNAGEEQAVRIRVALDGDRFRWKSGSKPFLYGLHRIEDARRAGHVALVEGESDCHTLWFHGIPAIGIPGAANWREDRDAGHLDGIDTIYVVVEPDQGGDAVREWLARSSIRHRAKLVKLPAKDPSALHLKGAEEFLERGSRPARAQSPGPRKRPRLAPLIARRLGSFAIGWPARATFLARSIRFFRSLDLSASAAPQSWSIWP